eukprot:scaffold123014_cov21-Tisochrysis_lutea.AAC.1
MKKEKEGVTKMYLPVGVTKPVRPEGQEQNAVTSFQALLGMLARTWLGHQPGSRSLKDVLHYLGVQTLGAIQMLELSAQMFQILIWAIQDKVLSVFKTASCRVCHSVPLAFAANVKLLWAPISMMSLDFYAKVVTGKV